MKNVIDFDNMTIELLGEIINDINNNLDQVHHNNNLLKKAVDVMAKELDEANSKIENLNIRLKKAGR